MSDQPKKSRAARLVLRLRSGPTLHVLDQSISSGTNFLAAVMVARNGTARQFGTFSIFLVIYYLLTGFNRSVPHAVAMTLEWDDERARNGYFFIPAYALGAVGTMVLVPLFGVIGPSFVLVPLLLLPMLVQDAVRMHAFAVQRPQVALASDAVWMATQLIGFVFISSAPEAAAAWGLGGLCAALVSRPWLRVRWQRRPLKGSLVSSSLEYLTLTGFGHLSPLLAGPFVSVQGIGALQGAGVIRGPIVLLVQALIIHRMAGPPVTEDSCVRAAGRLSLVTVGAVLASVPPLLLLKNIYGPPLLGQTWSAVEPLVLPTLLGLVVGAVTFGPATIARKMGRFSLSARVQMTLTPVFAVLSLAGAATMGEKGFLYGMAAGYVVSSVLWWTVLLRVGGRHLPPAASRIA